MAALAAAGCSSSNNQQGYIDPATGLGSGGSVGFGGAPPISTGGGGSSMPAPPQYNGVCPAMLFTPCKACHDGRGTAATPMGLMTWEDFHAPAPKNAGLQVYQILSQRLHSTTPTPMPPDGQLEASKLSAIDAWTQAGAPDCSAFAHRAPPPGAGGGPPIVGAGGGTPIGTGAGGTTPVGPGTGGGGPIGGSGGMNPVGSGGGGGMPTGTGGAPPYDVTPYLSPDGAYFIKEPPGSVPVGPDAKGADFCFNIVAHNAQAPLPGDTTPFQVKASEFYHAFQFKVPYTKPAWAVSTRPIIDNNKVLHHWLLFQMSGIATDGAHADEIGLQLGNALLTGWAPGGNPLEMSPDVGLEMPAAGGFLSMENHYYNTTGTTQKDRSGVRMCVTYTKPVHPASLTWFGTEAISIPPNAQGTATGSCTTWKKNGDVHFLQTVPHMHQIGSHMKTVINRAGGGQDILIDKPFAFTDQRAYAIDMVAHSGDTFTTTCTFQNKTAGTVGFGTSSTSEMCYNFVVYWPAHALDGVGGIEGSANMCLF